MVEHYLGERPLGEVDWPETRISRMMLAAHEPPILFVADWISSLSFCGPPVGDGYPMTPTRTPTRMHCSQIKRHSR